MKNLPLWPQHCLAARYGRQQKASENRKPNRQKQRYDGTLHLSTPNDQSEAPLTGSGAAMQ